MKATKDELILDREDQRQLGGILNAPLSERDHPVIPLEELLMRQHAEEHAKCDLIGYLREKVREIRGE